MGREACNKKPGSELNTTKLIGLPAMWLEQPGVYASGDASVLAGECRAFLASCGCLKSQDVTEHEQPSFFTCIKSDKSTLSLYT